MTHSKLAAVFATLAVTGAIVAQAPRGGAASRNPEVLPLTGDVENVHDPVIIKEGDTDYVFCTGGRPGQGVIPIRTSKDLRQWTLAGCSPQVTGPYVDKDGKPMTDCRVPAAPGTEPR